MKKQWYLRIAAAATLVADQLTKFFLEGRNGLLIPRILRLKTAYNDGVALSMLGGGNRNVLLLIITLAICAVVWIYASRHANSRLAFFSCGLIVGGGISNAADRIFRGVVVDLFEFDFMNLFIFNLADAAITIGVILLVISLFSRDGWSVDQNE